MGKTKQELQVYLQGIPVGYWKRDGRKHSFQYTAQDLRSSQAFPLSLSLPLAEPGTLYTGPQVEAYFDNLLPENEEKRNQLQHRFGCASSSAFDLLSELGRDCIGAVQILPMGEDVPSIKSIEGKPLSEIELENLLEGTVLNSTMAVPPEESLRISLAGAQEKTALLWHDGQWCRPLGTTPTTHIFKLPLGVISSLQVDMSLSLENEWLCLKILQAFGLETAHAELASFGKQKVLKVERFDRKLSPDGNYWLRLPQEDFCQATGISRVKKYENEGGPGILSIMEFLKTSNQSEKDRKIFLKAQLLFWLLAAPDGHAKNFSIFLYSKGRFALTPLYDVMSTYPVMGHEKGKMHARNLKMAMALQGKSKHYEWFSIAKRHWLETARMCGAEPVMQECIDEVIEQLPGVLDAVSKKLPPGFPQEVSQPIFEGMQKSIARLKDSV